MRKTAVNIARLLLALTFILSGVVKAVDPLGTQYKIYDYLAAIGLASLVPDFGTLASSVILSATEFLLGICLLFAIRRRLVSKILVVLMMVMTLLTLWLAIDDPVTDCGCFGDALVLTNWQTFWKNVVLLAAALIVWRYPLDMPRLISESNQWIVMNYSAFFILVIIAGRSLYTLPQFDFRPYHVGTNLREGWQRMMEGEDSPYTEFFIESTDEGEDITEAVLGSQGYTFLQVADEQTLAAISPDGAEIVIVRLNNERNDVAATYDLGALADRLPDSVATYTTSATQQLEPGSIPVSANALRLNLKPRSVVTCVVKLK